MIDLTQAAAELNEKGKTVVKGINVNELLLGLQNAGIDVDNLLIIGSFESQWSVVRKDFDWS